MLQIFKEDEDWWKPECLSQPKRKWHLYEVNVKIPDFIQQIIDSIDEEDEVVISLGNKRR